MAPRPNGSRHLDCRGIFHRCRENGAGNPITSSMPATPDIMIGLSWILSVRGQMLARERFCELIQALDNFGFNPTGTAFNSDIFDLAGNESLMPTKNRCDASALGPRLLRDRSATRPGSRAPARSSGMFRNSRCPALAPSSERRPVREWWSCRSPAGPNRLIAGPYWGRGSIG
jgi:hypothetical protein